MEIWERKKGLLVGVVLSVMVDESGDSGGWGAVGVAREERRKKRKRKKKKKEGRKKEEGK